MDAALEELEEIVGYRFRDRSLLSRSLTHRSRLSDPEVLPRGSDNERLEFLGDSILGFLVSEALLSRQPEATEGTLTKRKSSLVSAAGLYTVAKTLDLGKFLILGRGEEKNGGRAKKALLADAVEALLAGIYLDGGLEPARAFVERWVISNANGGEASELLAHDHKTELQELARARGLPAPRYVIVEERGPDHARTFVVEVHVGRELSGRAEGQSKKSAAKEAARVLMGKM